MDEEKKTKDSTVYCPVARVCKELENAFGKESRFLEHLRRSRIEFLKGVKALVEDRIEDLEKRAGKGNRKKKMEKIEVEG
jgi:hypothetical protein